MPLMTLNRNYVLITKAGRSVNFVKDKPTWVPPMILEEALAIGAESQEEHPQDNTDNEPEAPQDPSTRIKAIKEKIVKIVARNSRNDFTSAGAPKVGVVVKEVGFEVDKKEVDKAFAEYLAEQEELRQQAALDLQAPEEAQAGESIEEPVVEGEFPEGA